MNNSLKYFFVAFIVCIYTTVAVAEEKNMDGLPAPVRFVAQWLLNPTVPTGFEEIHRIEAKITDRKTSDIFILMTDSRTDQIVWFKKRGKYWNMTVIESIPTKRHTEYGVDIRQAKLFVNGKRLLYGLEGTAAISYYEWDSKKQIFIGYAL